MFFWISHVYLPSPALVVVSADGVPFLRALDVGRILGYRSPHQFAKRHARLKIKDVVYKNLDLSSTVLGTRILTVEKALDLLGNSRKTGASLARHWFLYLSSTRVLPLEPVRSDSNPRKAMRLRMMALECKNSTSFEEFLESFKINAMEFYEKKINDFESRRMEVHIRNKSLEELNLLEVPKNIFVHFGDLVYEFKKA